MCDSVIKNSYYTTKCVQYLLVTLSDHGNAENVILAILPL